MRRASIALVASGVAVGVAAEWASYLPDDPGQAAGDFAVGLAFVAGGALTLGRSRTTAVLMAATGFAWFAGGLATGLVFLHRGPLVHLLLSYPRGRLESRFERLVVGCAYAAALVQPLGRSNVVTLVLLAAVLLAAGVRYARAGGAERRARAAAFAATAAVAGTLGAAAILRLADAAADGTMLWVYEGVLTLVAAGLCADLLWGRWTAAAVRGLVMDLGDLEREATLRTRLARSVGDPSLELGFWDAGRGAYVDEAGEVLTLPAASADAAEPVVDDRLGRAATVSGRAVLMVDDDGGRAAAAIVHDRALLDEHGLAGAITAAVRMAVANIDLQSRVRAKVEEVGGMTGRADPAQVHARQARELAEVRVLAAVAGVRLAEAADPAPRLAGDRE